MVEIFDTDGSTMEIFLCMDLQTSNCLTLDYFYDPNGENSMLYYGTDQGFVNIFHFKNEKLTSSGITRQRESIETLFLERDPRLFKEWGTLWKRKTHSDWTLRVRYIPTAKLLISCSVDAKDSLAISFLDFAQKWQFSATSITKGANCLAFSLNPPCIITGGSDYNVRFWNPRRITTPIATLSGHSAPVIDLSVSNSNGQMVSLAIDKELRVWDIRRQHCLQSFTNHTKQQPENIFSSLYCDDARKVILASSALYYHKLNGRITHTDSVKMPSESIKACLLSNTFQSVVCGYEGGSIVIWDIATGERSFMFFETHGASEISAMCLGSNGRRLITGARGLLC
jgi:WD40 repeat protein